MRMRYPILTALYRFYCTQGYSAAVEENWVFPSQLGLALLMQAPTWFAFYALLPIYAKTALVFGRE